jgi:hypothetical protein
MRGFEMRNLIGVGLLLSAAAAFAQVNQGTITGTVTAEDVAVAAVTVQAKNTTTGKVYTTVTAKTGNFTIADMSAGTYEVSVPPFLGITRRYVRQNLVVGARETVRLDIALPGSPQNVVGDAAVVLAIHNTYAGLTGPAPRTADGKPDFSGVWLANGDPDPEPAASLPWAAEVAKERIQNNLRDWPWALCLPVEPYPSFAFLYRIVQNPSILVQLFIQEPHYRQVYLDGRAHPKDPDPTWMGHSIGNWDGDTLVIDSIGFNDKTWLISDLLPHTEMLHVIERYRRPDLAHLNIDVTIEDPGTFTKSLHRHMTWELAPGEDLSDYICTENNKYRENTDHK